MAERKPDYLEMDMGYDTPCWIWQKWIETKGRGKGYGKMSVNNRTKRAHKVYYERHFGVTVESHIHLDHLCKNRACVNPLHLEPVSHRENQDRRSKFDWDKAAAVRALKGKLSQQKIADQFGISRRYVRDILEGRAWVNGTTG